MKIIGYELKKIFNWRILMILLIFTVLFYHFYLHTCLTSDFDNGHPSTERCEAGIELMQKYGVEISPAEQRDFANVSFPKSKDAVNKLILGLPDFQKAGISSVDQFEALDQSDREADRKLCSKLIQTLFQDKTHNIKIPYSYDAKRRIVEYDFRQITQADMEEQILRYPGNKQDRIRIVKSRTALSPLPNDTLIVNYDRSAVRLSLLLLFTVMILVSPFLVGDKMNRIRQLTYSFRTGRRLYFSQLAAALIAAVAGVAVQLAIFFLLYFDFAHQQVPLFFKFFECDISGLEKNVYWFDLTFGQYIGIGVALMAALALGFTFFSFLLSHMCRTYVSVFAVQIPVAFIGGWLCNQLLSGMFSIGKAQWMEVWICAAILVVGFSLCIFFGWREQKVDID